MNSEEGPPNTEGLNQGVFQDGFQALETVLEKQHPRQRMCLDF